MAKFFPHLFLPDSVVRSHGYTTPPSGGGNQPRFVVQDREQHSAKLKKQLSEAWEIAKTVGKKATTVTTQHGAYMQFEGDVGAALPFISLEQLKSHVRLLNVRDVNTDSGAKTIATVFIPHEKKHLFFNKIQAYATQNTKPKKSDKEPQPKNSPLINSIADIHLAAFESFWLFEEQGNIPGADAAFVEVWLDSDNDAIIAGINAVMEALAIEQQSGMLKFPERTVLLVRANRSQLEQLVAASPHIAEFRIAKRIMYPVLEYANREQAAAAKNILSRTTYANDNNIVVCVLDTGVNHGHPLLQPVMGAENALAVIKGWDAHDHTGHGTGMAGLAIYGDLLDALMPSRQLRVDHRLESVKLLPDGEQTPPELWGDYTIQSVSQAEIQAPDSRRIVCMALTSSDTRERGRPSSWSAALDELSSGYSDDMQRLIIVSAGNARDPAAWAGFEDAVYTNEIHDPGQSWNALTVGAFTQKRAIHDPHFKGYSPIAPDSGLSPFSSNSYTWDNKWPIKPEILMEGGNAARKEDSAVNIGELQLLTTDNQPTDAHFRPFGMTSAAAALAARMAARIQHAYPNAWPETVRALMVHSATWPEAMKTQFKWSDDSSKRDTLGMLRLCGYGVPNLDTALRCASSSLTLIAQRHIQPYAKKDGKDITNEMHLFDLPWPVDELRDMVGVNVEMRVTLSYFVEPGPGERGWDDKYMYASHALRFQVNNPTNSSAEFLASINKQARSEGEDSTGSSSSKYWMIGDARNKGSIHSDIWRGSAQELAAAKYIAVYPVNGWWRKRQHLNRYDKMGRYSLIVSIHTPRQDVDIYTPVATKIGIPVPVEITV